MDKTLTATSAFQLLIQASSDAIDHREQGEMLGLIQPWMSQNEGIAAVLALLIRKGYESDISPKIMTSLLKKYCHHDLSEAFMQFFCQLAGQNGLEISADSLRNSVFDTHIDISQFAIAGKSLGWKASWGAFKEPYSSQWRNAFASS